MAQNALGVLLVAEALGASLAGAAQALGEFAPAKGRGERFVLAAPTAPITIIDESYNANPASMRARLRCSARQSRGEGGRRIAVIGDMLELGAEGAPMHAALAGELDVQSRSICSTAPDR